MTRPHHAHPLPNNRYKRLLEEARRGLTPAAAALRFGEEDLRTLVDSIHRRGAQIKRLKRQLLRRQEGEGQHERTEERMAGRLSLLSEIRGVSGLSLYDEGERR